MKMSRVSFASRPPAEEFSTLVHEVGREMLHRGDRRTLTTKQVRETEAPFVIRLPL
jgi:hypothetical protein